ncbi:MAG: class I SAM-dependent rRNA methyltransferase [Tagaea sp.]
MTDLPVVRLQPQRHKRVRLGHPWVFSNEIQMDNAAKAMARGQLVRVEVSHGEPLGIAMFNPHTLIAARLLDRDPTAKIDEAWIAKRIARARDLRERLYPGGHYRLIHAEADGLPGLIVDRYGDVLVVQRNAAGIEALGEALFDALARELAPKTIVLRDDSHARTLEGLAQKSEIRGAALDGPIPVNENGAVFFADPREGQKTGWFFDQRDNRASLASLCAGVRALDVYCYAGGFGVLAAKAGAVSVKLVDRSQTALDLAAKAADANDVAGKCAFERADAFDFLEANARAGTVWDVVSADPPAFAKSRKDVPAALKGYRKLAREAAQVVAPKGILFVASCSHNVEPGPFAEEVARGVSEAGRSARILRVAGAASDHPLHPHLPESAYLKALTLALD